MDAETDIAAAMGFSSFGAQDRPMKKRRYNPAADSAQQPASATGSNSAPLGTSPSTKQSDSADDAASPTRSAHLVGLPARPAPALDATTHPRSVDATTREQHHGSRKLWYQGYYDSTSNENPWERLEKSMGLDTKGSWVPRQLHLAASMTTASTSTD